MYRRILVPLDGSPTSLAGLDEAIRLAQTNGATLRLLHVVDVLSFASGFETYAAYANDVLPAMRRSGERVLETGRARAAALGVTVQTLLLESSGPRACELIVRQAHDWEADLIVIGTHGRRGVNRLLLGSDAEQVLRLAPVPVLLVRAPAV